MKEVTNDTEKFFQGVINYILRTENFLNQFLVNTTTVVNKFRGGWPREFKALC